MASHSNQDYEVSAARWNDSEQGNKELAEVDMRGVSPSEHNVATETLARKLSARQVQMIAIGGEYTKACFLAVHSRSVLTMLQVQSALVCSWERARVLPQVVQHLCSFPTLSSEPSFSPPCCPLVRWLLSSPLLARSVLLLGKYLRCSSSSDGWLILFSQTIRRRRFWLCFDLELLV